MKIKIATSLIASLLLVSCSSSGDAPADKSDAAGVTVAPSEGVASDVQRDSTHINENDSLTTKANELKETETFEGLDRYLSDSAEAWVDGATGAASKGVLPMDAVFTVNGTDFRELTSSLVKPADGISLGLTLRKVTCTMVGTFYEKADLNMGFAWAAPTCTA